MRPRFELSMWGQTDLLGPSPSRYGACAGIAVDISRFGADETAARCLQRHEFCQAKGRLP